ncbi:MAG: hypothetical protein HY282_16960 [Nitrospirae bacterium]|nr:hypothetical protein [Candidatus Manganitrophaceae bacterium]
MNGFENRKTALIVSLVLATFMAATRFHPIGSVVGLGDASLAAFFLSGFYLQSIFFPAFLAEAALIDYAATVGGGSDWCITPAYLFLIPTYATLWWAGRWYARRHRSDWQTLLPLSLTLFVSASTAFLISNASFYLFSKYFAEMSVVQYAAGVARYYPHYVMEAFGYVVLAVSLHLIAGAIRRARQPFPPPMRGAS